MSNIEYFSGNKKEDDLIMLNFLKLIDFKSGTARRNMYKNLKDNPGGSILFGLTWKGYLSKDKNRTKQGEDFFRKAIKRGYMKPR